MTTRNQFWSKLVIFVILVIITFMVILKIYSPIIWYFLWFLEKITYNNNLIYYVKLDGVWYHTWNTKVICITNTLSQVLYDVMWRVSQNHLRHVWMWHKWKPRQMWPDQIKDIFVFGFSQIFFKIPTFKIAKNLNNENLYSIINCFLCSRSN